MGLMVWYLWFALKGFEEQRKKVGLGGRKNKIGTPVWR